MHKLIVFAKKYRFSLLCLALIWYLCIWFMPPEFPELEDVAFIDKWTHFVMYGGTCSVIWQEYLRNHPAIQALPLLRGNWRRLFLLAWLAPVAMSGCIEIIQEYCTENRAGEWLDLAANAIGCTLGAAIGLLMVFIQRK